LGSDEVDACYLKNLVLVVVTVMSSSLRVVPNTTDALPQLVNVQDCREAQFPIANFFCDEELIAVA